MRLRSRTVGLGLIGLVVAAYAWATLPAAQPVPRRPEWRTGAVSGPILTLQQSDATAGRQILTLKNAAGTNIGYVTIEGKAAFLAQVKTGAVATGSLPAVTAADVGSTIYDTTTNGPKWVNNAGSWAAISGLGTYLPLSGGTVTGLTKISVDAGFEVNDSFPSNVFVAKSTGVDTYQLLKARSGLKVGATGTTLNKVQLITETINLGNITANTTADEDVTPAATVPNSVQGIFMGCASLENGLVVQSFDGTSAGGHLLFRVSNLTGSDINPASHSYQFMIIDP